MFVDFTGTPIEGERWVVTINGTDVSHLVTNAEATAADPLAAVIGGIVTDLNASGGGNSVVARAEGTRIRTTVVPSGDAVSVTMVLADAAGAPLPSQRVSLQRHGRAVFSAHTDDAGLIALPSLERGVYEVSCPGVAAAFRLDLRSAS